MIDDELSDASVSCREFERLVAQVGRLERALRLAITAAEDGSSDGLTLLSIVDVDGNDLQVDGFVAARLTLDEKLW